MSKERRSRTDRNDQLVLTALRARSPLTKLELTDNTGLAPSTLTGVLERLMRRSDVTVALEPSPGRGRPAQRFHLAGKPALVAFARIRRQEVDLSIINDEGRAEKTVSAAFDGMSDGGPFTALGNALTRLDVRPLSASDGDRVVVSVPFPVHQGRRSKRAGRLPEALGARAKIVPAWFDADLHALFANVFGMPVLIENDANLAALGESSSGAGVGSKNFIHIEMAEGLGAGIVINQHLVRGAVGFAGEVAHAHVNDNGPVCSCGSFGCLATQTSIYSIISAIRPAFGVKDLTLHDMAELSALGDGVATRALRSYGDMIGRFVANACVILNPELISVDARLGAAGEPVRDGLRSALERFAPGAAADSVRVEQAHLDEPQFNGALTLARQAGAPAST